MPGLPRFTGGAVGYLGYECMRYFEDRVPQAENDVLGMPEAVFMFTDTLLVFDHLQHKIKVVSHFRLDGDVEAAYRQAAWRIEELVGRLETAAGQLPYSGRARACRPSSRGQQQPLARGPRADRQRGAEVHRRGRHHPGRAVAALPASDGGAPFDVYRALRAINPSPYMFYLDLGDAQLVGTSPEMLVRVEDGKIDYHPIAGTRRRGADAEEDAALEEELVNDEKERAEHVMLLDLGRNDVGRVSRPAGEGDRS